MAWPYKNHLDNLEEILLRLHWLVQPDTILTELPYDLEFISKTDIERFADWCRSAVAKHELEEGKYSINRLLIKFFVEKSYPDLSPDQQKEKGDLIYLQLYELLKLPRYETIVLNETNVGKIIDILNSTPGESHFDKTVKKIKVAVALKWLQNSELSKNLSKDTTAFISRIGDFYGRAKKGEHVYVKDIGAYLPPEEDKKNIIGDFEKKVEIALMEASQDIKKAKTEPETNSVYGQFSNIIKGIKKLEDYLAGKYDNSFDEIEHFKVTIFIVILLNYIQDPYIKRTPEASNLLKVILPVYTKYKELKNL